MEIYWLNTFPLQKQVENQDFQKPVSLDVVVEKERVPQDFFGNIKLNQGERERDGVTAVSFL